MPDKKPASIDLRTAVEVDLRGRCVLMGASDAESSKLINDEVARLKAAPPQERKKFIENVRNNIERINRGMADCNATAKQVREFLEAKENGQPTDNPFYEAVYRQMEATVDKGLAQAEPGKPLLILMGVNNILIRNLWPQR